MEDVKVPSWEQIGGRLSRGAHKEHREDCVLFMECTDHCLKWCVSLSHMPLSTVYYMLRERAELTEYHSHHALEPKKAFRAQS